ncbi:hypothetical protein E2562_002366 [Oryza meyeriana var. granulata]|uniref:Uncharacterized protein n=1 Tax=Oryza meyeriana var. granulata TaxID=110450 RepID=A0A6G1BI95_9ORYZ|nr:hypothetical protein E2562_002366 [Oryza meyeriana var. granulata]
MTFLQARSFLLQEEVWIANRAQKAASTALLAASRSDGASSNAPTTGSTALAPAPPASPAGGASDGNGRPHKCKKQAGRIDGQHTGNSGAPMASWVNP